MNMKKIVFKLASILALALLLVVSLPFFSLRKVVAAGLSIYYGSESYTTEPGEEFSIGIYLEAQEGRISEYTVELGFNPLYLEYVSGATSDSNESITIHGEGTNRSQIKTLVRFWAKAGGGTGLWVRSAEAKDRDGNAFEIASPEELPTAPISITPAEDTLLDMIYIGEQQLAGYAPYQMNYSMEADGSTDVLAISATGPSEITVSDTTLAVGDNHIYITSTAGDAVGIYDIYVKKSAEIAVPQPAQQNEAVTDDTQSQKDTSTPLSIKMRQMAAVFDSRAFALVVILLNTFTVFLIVISILARRQRYVQAERERRRAFRKRNHSSTEMDVVDLGSAQVRIADIEDMNAVADMEHLLKHEKPVIAVQDVCMDFRIATQNVSGIKEMLIQAVKGQISYRTLHALNHVTFNVYKGEVVGVIGTNGSGKSTLLKLVSGAMSPTSGKVLLDRSKVQLLTLGTGFDMELTARENVYLNGAIIGYDREFIDDHYDSIVEFAELEDFMEEKMKNFSSGMVSRLAFAIATAEEAPEILLLDEVLSVGDEFFRKKSLKRIKEMIHGGSTVLMVSHGMDTIIDNCTKVVWIEKGQLKMVGEPQQVCAAYRALGN